MNTLDCIIFCTGKMSVQDLRTTIAIKLGVDIIHLSFIEMDFYELSIRKNDNYDYKKEMNFPDGFLFFKFIIEFGFNNECQINECVQVTAKLLEFLWSVEMPAVASCDYEYLLPYNGGYKSKLIPWPKL